MAILKFPNSDKQQGSKGFDTLIGPHLLHLYQLAYRFCGSQSDAEDLVQDLVVKLLPRLEEMSQIERLRPWLAKVLYRQFVDNFRRAERSPVTLAAEPEDMADSQPENAGETPESATESIWAQQRLQIALETLNSDQQAVVIMHDVEGYTLAELEQILETPLGTLKSRLNRARGQLREILQKER